MSEGVAPQRSSAVLEGFSSLSIIRQVGLMIGLAASVAVGMAVVLWSKEPAFRPLYTDISNLEANQVADILQTEGIKFDIDTHSGILMVEADKIHKARLKLASSGFPTGNGIGYELLDKDQGFGTSQFLEKARYHRSLEGELSKTIASISTVRGARVHLAIPKKTVFVGDNRKPSASVLVDLYPGRALEKGQVASIVHLVASSIPQMSVKQVTVVDQQGTLLSENDQEDDIRLAARNLDFTRKIEQIYLGRVNSILEPILGMDSFKVELTADLDFTRLEQTSETFNPDLPALRSEQVLDEIQGDGAGASGIPGALSNQPPGAASVPEQANNDPAAGDDTMSGANGNRRNQATRNYELDRTISHTQHQMGRLRRLSVAVVVDGFPSPAGGGEGGEGQEAQAWTPIPPQELARIEDLVKDAIGYDPQRGDSVNVVNQRFLGRNQGPADVIPEPALWEQPWFWEVSKQGLGILLVLALVLGVLRPILNNLAKAGDVSAIPDEIAQMDLAPLTEDDEPDGEELAIEGGPETLLPGPEQSYETQLTAIKNMVASDPRLVAQVVKQWVAKD